MLNLFSLKEKKEEGGKGPATKKKASAAQLRITKVWPPWCTTTTLFYSLLILCFVSLQDINELELPKTCKTEFPDPDDLLSFKLIIYPDEVKSRPAHKQKRMFEMFFSRDSTETDSSRLVLRLEPHTLMSHPRFD